MIYLLDTNVLVYCARGRPEVIAALAQLEGLCVTSVLCLAEFERGVAVLAGSDLFAADLIDRVQVLAFDQLAVHEYKRIIAALGYNRRTDWDRMIAAHAISMGAILLTSNVDDFADIPGLKIHPVEMTRA